MKKFTIFLILICSNINSVKSQSQKEANIIADKLYKEMHFQEAYKIYKRVLFFKDSINEYDYFKLGACKEAMRDSMSAVYYYKLGINISQEDSVKALYLIKISNIHIQNQNYSNAIYYLLISREVANQNQLSRINFLLGSCYYLNEDFVNSKKYFLYTLKEDSLKLESCYAKVYKKYPNPKTALWLSVIFPGLGQFYTGEIREGLNSLILNSFLVGIFVYTSKESSFITASLSISPWMYRYLQGGAENAERLARKKINRRNKMVLKEIINLIKQ